VFSVGVLYADVDKLKQEMLYISDDLSRYEATTNRVSVLQMQVDKAEQIQDKLAYKLDAIDTSLRNIEVGVARLEERMVEKQKVNK